MTDLASLAYPRHVHRGDGSVIVRSVAEAIDALAHGYELLPAGAEYDVVITAPAIQAVAPTRAHVTTKALRAARRHAGN